MVQKTKEMILASFRCRSIGRIRLQFIRRYKLFK